MRVEGITSLLLWLLVEDAAVCSPLCWERPLVLYCIALARSTKTRGLDGCVAVLHVSVTDCLPPPFYCSP